MNAAAIVPIRHPAVQLVGAWHAQAGALLLVGHAPGPMPRAGTAQAGPGWRGVFRAVSWPLETRPGHPFLAAVRFPDRATVAEGAEFALRGARANDTDIRLVLPPAFGEVEFGQLAGRTAGQHAATVARFLLDVLRPQDENDMRRPSTMLTSFLTEAAQPDGCVELMLCVPDECVLLQGWGPRASDPVEVLLVGPLLRSFAAQPGSFPRADVPAPATGLMLALPPEAADALSGLEKVFILSATTLHSRTIVEHRLLDPADSIGHIQHLLPGLSCPAAMQATLRSALRPRYDGRDTINSGPHPVRAAVDTSAASPGCGTYISGWVFDPARALVSVELCDENEAERIDLAWVRVPRNDVSEAFRLDPALSTSADHSWGFAVSTVLAPTPGQPGYLRFTFKDGDSAFLPLHIGTLDTASLRARIMDSVDLYKSSGPAIIEQHLGPLIARLRPGQMPLARIVIAGPLEREHAIVVALPEPGLPRAFLSGFLQDPLQEDEQLVLVCGPDWTNNNLDTLRMAVRFYALPATILLASDRIGPAAALQQAAAVTSASDFLLCAPCVVSTAQGWRQALRMAARGADFACPTILYEDWSIRFAGVAEMAFHQTPPYAECRIPLAGLSPAHATAAASVPAEFGTFACCFLRRGALAPLQQAPALGTDAGQEAAYFLNARSSELSGLWAPAVQVYAPEDAPRGAGRVAQLVDGWALRSHGQGEVSCAF